MARVCRVLPCGFLWLLFGIKKCWRGRAAVLNCDLKGLGFPKVTIESEKAMTAFSYTWFTWPVLGSLRCDTWVVPLPVLNPLRLPGTVPLTPW